MDSFKQIYELYFKDVYRYILSLSQDAVWAEEITQETFFQAMKSIDTFRGDCRMFVWLCQIAKHIYYADRKKRGRNIGFSAQPESGFEVILPGSEMSFEGLLCDEEDAMKIHEYLHRMEEPYKEVFMLRIFGELSFKKIAHIFGKTESWARVTYHRAKLKIISKMEESNG